MLYIIYYICYVIYKILHIISYVYIISYTIYYNYIVHYIYLRILYYIIYIIYFVYSIFDLYQNSFLPYLGKDLPQFSVPNSLEAVLPSDSIALSFSCVMRNWGHWWQLEIRSSSEFVQTWGVPQNGNLLEGIYGADNHRLWVPKDQAKPNPDFGEHQKQVIRQGQSN